MISLLFSVALAGPSRCVATWTGPAPGCAIRAPIVASGAALSEKAARRALAAHLDSVIELTIVASRARLTTLGPAEFAACSDIVSRDAYVNCFEEPALAAPAFCFVGFDDPTCWTGEVLEVEDVGWRALQGGRDKMCTAVDTRIVSQKYTDEATRRPICAAACASKTTVRCP